MAHRRPGNKQSEREESSLDMNNRKKKRKGLPRTPEEASTSDKTTDLTSKRYLPSRNHREISNSEELRIPERRRKKGRLTWCFCKTIWETKGGSREEKRRSDEDEQQGKGDG